MIISKFKKSVIMTSSALTICILGTFFAFNASKKTILHDDYIMYDSQNLVQEADVIVEGNIINTSVKKIKYLFSPEKTYKNDEDKRLYTVSTMKITKVIKGSLKIGTTIEIKQTGDGKKVIDQELMDNGGYFQKGSTQLVFLKDYSKFKVPYGVINPSQSVYTVGTGGTIKTSPNNDLFNSKSNVDSKTLTSSTSNTTQEEQLVHQIQDLVNSTK